MQAGISHKHSKFYALMPWALVVLLLYLSGNIFFMAIHYSNAVLLVALFTFALYIFRKKFTVKCELASYIIAITLVLLLLVTILINNESNLSPYIAITLQIAIAFIAASIIDFDRFKTMYITAVFVLAAISLLCFFAFQAYPRIALFFPRTPAVASLDYYNAFAFVFTIPTGSSVFTAFNRNSGIFWEPGAYQAFLNLALLFLLDKIKKGEDVAYPKIKIIIFLITIFTTFSTNGYLILFLIIIAFRNVLVKSIFATQKQFVLALIISTIFGVFLLSFSTTILPFDRIVEKFTREFSNGASNALSRISIDKLKYLFPEGSLNFLGMSFSGFEALHDSCWNSIIHTMIALGIPFSLLLLYGYLNFSIRLMSKPLLSFVVFVMFFSTETLFWRPLFLYFIFTAFHKRKEKKKKNENTLALQHDVA